MPYHRATLLLGVWSLELIWILDFGFWIFHTGTPGSFSSTTPIIIQRAGLLESPTAPRAAEPSLEITTRWCIPAPCGSIATWGAPSASPALLIGWQITSRQPSKLGCLRVATTLPSTRANNINSNHE